MKYRDLYCTPKYSDGEKLYYGQVEGEPSIELIEAATLEDFERLFHQAVDDFLDGQGRKRRHFGALIVSVLAVIALGVAMALTCPDKAAHKEAIVNLCTEAISGENDDEWGILANLVGGKLAGVIIDGATARRNPPERIPSRPSRSLLRLPALYSRQEPSPPSLSQKNLCTKTASESGKGVKVPREKAFSGHIGKIRKARVPNMKYCLDVPIIY